MLNTLHKVELKLLRTFVTIVHCGGFTAALAELNTNQSTISTQMSQLETRLGMRLCERGHAGFHLTPEGEEIYRIAKKLFAEIEHFVDGTNECARAMKGELRLGIMDNIVANPECKIDQALIKLNEEAPEVGVFIRGCTTSDLESLVLEGEVHLGVGVFTHFLPNLTYQPLCNEINRLYCGPAHPLFGKPESEITGAALEGSKYIDWGLKTDMSFPDIQESVATSIESILLKLFSGNWISFVPECAAEPWVSKGKLQPLLADQLEVKLPVQMVTRQSASHSRILLRAMDLLIEAHANGNSQQAAANSG